MMNELILPILVTFAIAVAIGPLIIPILKKLKFGQVVRDDGPKSHLSKSGTPTMGGFIIIISTIVGILIFTKEYGSSTILFILSIIGFALVGFADDFMKVVLKRSTGLRAWQKASVLLLFSLIIGYFIYKYVGTELKLPFTDRTWDIGLWIMPLTTFVLLATTNSANLTDGLDGLMTGINFVYFGAFAIAFAMIPVFYDNEMLIISTSMVGASLGFLIFNTYPARAFMGDTGSLSLGGAIGMIALLSKTAIWIPFMALMLVASSISVIIQVGYYKKTKKRVFKMAPLHHHFEQLGYPEMKITTVYILITTILCFAAILAIK